MICKSYLSGITQALLRLLAFWLPIYFVLLKPFMIIVEAGVGLVGATLCLVVLGLLSVLIGTYLANKVDALFR